MAWQRAFKWILKTQQRSSWNVLVTRLHKPATSHMRANYKGQSISFDHWKMVCTIKCPLGGLIVILVKGSKIVK